MNATTTLGDLQVGTRFRLSGREHRVLRHWSTGVEIAEVASWGLEEKQVVSGSTSVVSC